MSFVDVGAESEFPDGAIRVIEADGREIGVLRWNGRWLALRNICPHLGAPLCEGRLQPLLRAQSVWSDDLIVDPDRPVVLCPWHHWAFDIASGHEVTGAKRARTYSVTLSAGRVLVDLGASSARLTEAGQPDPPRTVAA
jgi:nitrite reductase/ring-hydroxylating ferredoxin subunit